MSWIDDNLTDKMLVGVVARRKAVDDEYEDRKAKLKEYHDNGSISEAEYTEQLIVNDKLYAKEKSDLETEIAKDKVDANAWAQESIYANMQDSLSAQIIIEDNANQERLDKLNEYVAQGLMTEQQADKYAVDSEKLKNEKIDKLREDDLKNQEEKRKEEIEKQKEKLADETKSASSFYDYLNKRYKEDHADFRTEQEKKVSEWEEYYETLNGLAEDFSRTTKSTLSDMLFDGVKGDMQSFQSYWQSFWNSMLKSITDTVANMVVEAGTETVVDYFMSMLSSYAVGSYEIDKDQLALIHAGEMILPAGEAETFRESLESNTGMTSLAEANPHAYATFSNNAMQSFTASTMQHAATTIAGGIQYGAAPTDILSAVANPWATAVNAMFATWEGAEAAIEEAMDVQGTSLSEDIGNFASAAAMAAGITPMSFAGVVAGKTISTLVDMAFGAMQSQIAERYEEQIHSGVVSSMFDSLADALDARPYEHYLDQIETDFPDLSINDKYEQAKDMSDVVFGYYNDLFSSNSGTSFDGYTGDIGDWAQHAASSLGYGETSPGFDFGVSSNFGSGYGDFSSSDSDRSKFHTGGVLNLRDDEGYFIGQQKEGVVSVPGMELLESINSGKLSSSYRNDLKSLETLLNQILIKMTEMNQTQNDWNENGVPVVSV